MELLYGKPKNIAIQEKSLISIDKVPSDEAVEMTCHDSR